MKVSSEDAHIALAIGFVVDISTDEIKISVDKNLNIIPIKSYDFDNSDNQEYVTAMDLKGRILYRIDKDTLGAGMGLIRGNLVELFTEKGDMKRRNLIVDLDKPKFLHKHDYSEVDHSNLNQDQVNAIERVLSGCVRLFLHLLKN
jgi:DNA replication ATP-dependent helicase Dna2